MFNEMLIDASISKPMKEEGPIFREYRNLFVGGNGISGVGSQMPRPRPLGVLADYPCNVAGPWAVFSQRGELFIHVWKDPWLILGRSI